MPVDQISAANLSIRDLQVKFGSSIAVSGASLEIDAGEFFTLLGPSGCGKTTILRTIAGFNRQSAGQILIGGQTVDSLPPYRRDTGMVFQNYAIFPHLTVSENVAYGLKSRGVGKADIRTRVAEALKMVDLQGYEDRLPKQLSGGQQQRVVIARAIVVRPQVLLMDEPLANLDAKLRARLRKDLKTLQSELGITTIYVTHDQEEALSLSDRVAVMSNGHVLQVGKPEEIYKRPVSLAVAKFIGEANFFVADVKDADFVLLEGRIGLRVSLGGLQGNVWVGFRPEDAEIVDAEAASDNVLVGTIRQQTYLGAYIRYDIDCGLSQPVSIQTAVPDSGLSRTEGDKVGVKLLGSRLLVFPGSDQEHEL